MTTVEALGALLLGLGAICIFGARLIEWVIRRSTDSKVESKEEELNEANKKSDDAYTEYQRLKREYESKK